MNPMKAEDVSRKLHALADTEIAEHSKRFFKTGPGEYAEGDQFLGIRGPEQRKIAQNHKELPLIETKKLLRSDYHEERLTALFILEYKFRKASEKIRSDIYSFYIENIPFINNWDFIDSSAPKIMGEYLKDKPRDILYKLAGSENVWERRIAIMTTFRFIKNSEFEDTLNIADLLLDDGHDLIHKATGWMLREVGKKDQTLLEQFLKPRYHYMPRTMLRYAIEKLPENLRTAYLKGTVS